MKGTGGESRGSRVRKDKNGGEWEGDGVETSSTCWRDGDGVVPSPTSASPSSPHVCGRRAWDPTAERPWPLLWPRTTRRSSAQSREPIGVCGEHGWWRGDDNIVRVGKRGMGAVAGPEARDGAGGRRGRVLLSARDK